jgi:acetyl esterase
MHHDQAEEQTASIHRVKGKPIENRRCIIYFHGGRNMFGSAEAYETIVNRLAVESDSTVINVNFRLCPETKFPLPIYDGYAAVKDVLEKASEFGVNPEKVCLCGDGGGATIVLGIMQEMIRKEEQAKIAMLFVIQPMCGDFYVNDCVEEKDWSTVEWQAKYMNKTFIYDCMAENLADQMKDPNIFPIHMGDSVAAKMPPTAIYTSEFDCYMRDQESLAGLLQRGGNLTDFTILPGASHGFFFQRPDIKCSEQFFTDFGKIIDKFLVARSDKPDKSDKDAKSDDQPKDDGPSEPDHKQVGLE